MPSATPNWILYWSVRVVGPRSFRNTCRAYCGLSDVLVSVGVDAIEEYNSLGADVLVLVVLGAALVLVGAELVSMKTVDILLEEGASGAVWAEGSRRFRTLVARFVSSGG